ncbi:MAG: type II secretion system F family protein [Nitrospirota bacterium]
MPLFYYKAGREDGSILTKEVQAESEEVLRRELEESGHYILQLKKKGAFGLSSLKGFKKQKTEDFLIFNQELLVLIRAGLPIVQSLDILMERTPNETFKNALTDVKGGVRAGKALSDAMADHPRFFSELYCNSLRAGERTGNLSEVLERYIVYLKRMLNVKRDLISAATYPIILIGATTALLIVLLTYVVPSFSQIYSDFKSDLPLPTVILMHITGIIRRYIGMVAIGLVAAVFAFRAWYKTDGGRKIVDGYLLKFPVLGKLISGYITSNMTRTLSTILSGGIPMLQALEMVARSVTNREVSLKLRYAQERVREGSSLANALDETKILPAMTIRMIEVGEATGALEHMLDDISNFYEEEMNIRVKRATNLIEPIIMLSMGLVVGSIIIIMYLPIFELAGAVK